MFCKIHRLEDSDEANCVKYFTGIVKKQGKQKGPSQGSQKARECDDVTWDNLPIFNCSMKSPSLVDVSFSWAALSRTLVLHTPGGSFPVPVCQSLSCSSLLARRTWYCQCWAQLRAIEGVRCWSRAHITFTVVSPRCVYYCCPLNSPLSSPWTAKNQQSALFIQVVAQLWSLALLFKSVGNF